MLKKFIYIISLVFLTSVFPLFNSSALAAKVEVPLQDWSVKYYGSISILHDSELNKDILTTNNSYAYVVNPSTSGSLGFTQQYLTLQLKSTYYVSFYIRVKATDNKEYYIYYFPYEGSIHSYGSYIYVPMGSNFIDGQWHTLIRNIKEDLYDGAGAQLKEVMYFIAYGKFSLTDLILYDELPLDVDITSPVDGSRNASLLADISGTVGDGVESVDINGEEAQVEGGTFNADGVVLTEKNTVIRAIASNSAGEFGADKITLSIADELPDPLLIPHKCWRIYYGGGEIKVEYDDELGKDVLKFPSGTSTGAAIYGSMGSNGLGIAKKILNFSIKSDNYCMFYVCVGTKEGRTYYLSCPVDTATSGWQRITKDIALDLKKQYNQTFDSIKWFYLYYRGNVWLDNVHLRDSLPPLAKITTPLNDYVSDSLLINVSGNITDSNVDKVSVNGKEAIINGDEFIVENIPLTAKDTTIIATAFAKSEAIGMDGITVHISPDPPDPVTLPYEGFEVYGSNVKEIVYDSTLNKEVLHLTYGPYYSFIQTLYGDYYNGLGIKKKYAKLRFRVSLTGQYFRYYFIVKSQDGRTYYLGYPDNYTSQSTEWQSEVIDLEKDLKERYNKELESIQCFYMYCSSDFYIDEVNLADVLTDLITVSSPADGEIVNSLLIDVTGTYSSGVTDIDINDYAAEMQNGTFILRDLAINRKEYTIEVEAADSNGEKEVESINVTTDLSNVDRIKLPPHGWEAFVFYGYPTIAVRYSEELRRDVVEAEGTYLWYGSYSPPCWNIQNEYFIFEVKNSYHFTSGVRAIGTDDETYYLYYTSEEEPGYTDDFIASFYLGPEIKDGKWHRFVRNIDEDLFSAKGVHLKEVDYITFSGSPLVGDVIFSKYAPPPLSIDITTPSDGLLTNQGNVNVGGEVYDDSNTTFSVTMGEENTPLTDGLFTIENIQLQEGANNIEVCARNAFGEEAVDSVIVTLDTIPPVINITSHEDGAIVNTPAITLKGTVDGESFSEVHNLTEGVNTITKDATDAAGNTASVSIAITLDTVPPTITLEQPDTPTNQDVVLSYVVSDNLTPEDKIKVLGDDSPYVNEGDCAITLWAIDEAGNRAFSNVVNFTIDKTPPEIIITSPQNGIIVYAPTIIVEGTIDGAAFSEERTLQSSGENTITKTATDEAGNTSEASITIIYDTSILTVSPVISPTNVDTQAISGTRNSAMKEVQVLCSTAEAGVVSYPDYNSWTCSLTNLTEGQNNIVVVAKDASGNELSQILGTVVLDVTAPNLSPGAEVLDKHNVEITFSEEVTGAGLISNYSITPSLGSFTIGYQGNNKYILSFENAFETGANYLIEANGITDTAGNLLESNKDTATFYTNQSEILALLASMTGANSFGSSLAPAGDVNGDGFDDVIVGNYDDNSKTGKVCIYFGNSYIDDAEDLSMVGEAAGDRFGWSVASAGDVNGDGFDDVIIGAYWNDEGGLSAGKAYIYFGGSSMDSTVDVSMVGESRVDVFGYSVASAGDVNGDGFDDVIIGAILNDDSGDDAGKAYIYFGGSSMDNVADITMLGEASDDEFGSRVASAGDLNGDGFDDVIVGVAGNDEAGRTAGKVYIYFGSSSMDNVADITMLGEATYDGFGSSVAFAGDVNGDGFDDVIVGAGGNDEAGSSAGKTYLYFGGSSMDNVADIAMLGEASYDSFGWSASCAGDVNKDGFDDVIVGAGTNDEGGSAAGKAYIYFGGSSMDNVADITMLGEASGGNFGSRVASAGDVNGDGFYDVVCAATNFSIKKVYIYGIDGAGPHLFSPAAIIDENTVEITYSERVKRADNRENYSITPYLEITNAIAKENNIYRLTLASSPTLGVEYIITADNIVDTADNIINPAHNQATFVKGSSFMPIVDSFLAVDIESGDSKYTNSSNVRVLMEERGIEGEVAKWLITESSAQPGLTDFTLSERPTAYTIQRGEGTVTLYAWVMDEANNISIATPDSQHRIILDTTNPQITSFEVLNDRTLKIVFNERVKGADLPGNYTIEPGLGAISIAPSVGIFGVSDRAYELTFEEPQVLNQLYTLSMANISDLAGNPLLQEEIIFTGQAPSIPTVADFVATDSDSGSSAYTNSSTVSISMTESDIGGDIAKWLITESPAQPVPSDFVLTQRPAAYTMQSGEGEVTLYAWVMDEANNISIATPNSEHTIIFDTVPPQILPGVNLPDRYSIEITYSEAVLNGDTNRNWDMAGSDGIIFTYEGASDPAIAIDDEDNIHWAWCNRRNGEIWYAKTNKAGDILISPHVKFAAFIRPYIIISANGEICWTFTNSYDIYFAKTDKEGNILINAKKIFSSGASYYDPAITADFYGGIHWAWYDSSGHNIYYAKTDDMGSIIIAPRAQFGGPNYYECALTTDKDGNINFAFRDVDDDLWYAKMDESGNVLVPKFKIFTTGATGWFEPTITVDMANEICWIWRNNDDNKLWFAKTDVEGNVVEDIKTFNTSSSHYYNPFVAMDRSNTLYIAWEGKDDNIYWNRMSGSGADYIITPSLGEVIAWNKHDNVYLLRTAQPWALGQEYSIAVNGVTDLAGNPLSGGVSFTTPTGPNQGALITYDDLNRIKSITQYGKTTTYTYDEVGNITNVNVEEEL